MNEKLTLRAIIRDLHRNNLAPTKAQNKNKRGSKSSMKNAWVAKIHMLTEFHHKFDSVVISSLDNEEMLSYNLSKKYDTLIIELFILTVAVYNNPSIRIDLLKYSYFLLQDISYEIHLFWNKKKSHMANISPYDAMPPTATPKEVISNKEKQKILVKEYNEQEERSRMRQIIKQKMQSGGK